MRKSGGILCSAAAAGALAAALAARADSFGQTIDLKPGQEVTFTAAVVDGRVTLGTARVSKLGTAEPKDGEITVGVAPKVKPFYAELRAREKTSAPVDFVATGWLGSIKIDEIVLCGRLDMPLAVPIANAAWTISLNRFAPGKGDESCR